ncbi:MAG: DNA-processing protein DprA [Leptonema sp. (in: Bacteria)]|nr:DNA-processing protein DprA [Leptonema sp. (in: bacteria)]
MNHSRLRTALFIAALPFRVKIYRSIGWPDMSKSVEPTFEHSDFLNQFFTKAEIENAVNRADQYLNESKDLNQLRATFFADTEYPTLLKHIFDPPPVLFSRGSPLLVEPQYVAAVGTRYPDRITIKAIDYFGDRLCEMSSIADIYNQFTDQLTVSIPYKNQLQPSLFDEPVSYSVNSNELVTVSGFAIGVDERVHRISIYRKIPTVAVLGSGVDHITPPLNRYLIDEANRFQTQLTFVSEFFPNEMPRKFSYPRRNRIIAGMSPLCIVFQASYRSGALITAGFALDEGRDIWAFDHPKLATIGKNDGARTLLEQGAIRLNLLQPTKLSTG